MQVPLQIVFEHVEQSDAIEAAIRKEAQKLERFFDRITSARVVIDRPQHRHQRGDAYNIRIHISLPAGKHIDITRESAADSRHEDAYVTIRDAFDAAGRQLQDQARILNGSVKSPERP
jgi:ribosomal subunit interface protein